MSDDGNHVLERAAQHAIAFRSTLHDRPVGARAVPGELRAALGGPLPDGPTDAERVIDDFVGAVGDGVVAMAGPRFFGFVIGGSLPVAVAADWLTSAWDQNAGLYVGGPGTTIAEEIAGAWMLDLLGLPSAASFAFVTGCQMAHVTALAAARESVLSDAGWDMNADGLVGAPEIKVFVGQERHITVDRALRLLGIGSRSLAVVSVDDQGRLEPEDLASRMAEHSGPAIVCAQAGNIDTGAFDPMSEIVEVGRRHGALVHIDGAFGLWAAASPRFRHLLAGHQGADSWATDAHKWLNVPYDSGFVAVAHPGPHQTAMAVRAPYLEYASGEEPPRDPVDWTPEFSRRARGVPVYASLRHLGRGGVADIVERSCDHARDFAHRLDGREGARVLNDVVLNQVLVSFGSNERTAAVVSGVQAEGTCWLSGTTRRGEAAMRISVCGASTTAADVEASADAILRVAAATP